MRYAPYTSFKILFLFHPALIIVGQKSRILNLTGEQVIAWPWRIAYLVNQPTKLTGPLCNHGTVTWVCVLILGFFFLGLTDVESLLTIKNNKPVMPMDGETTLCTAL